MEKSFRSICLSKIKIYLAVNALHRNTVQCMQTIIRTVISTEVESKRFGFTLCLM